MDKNETVNYVTHEECEARHKEMNDKYDKLHDNLMEISLQMKTITTICKGILGMLGTIVTAIVIEIITKSI